VADLDICKGDERAMNRQEQAKNIVEEEFEKAAGIVQIKLSQRGFSQTEIVRLITDNFLGKKSSR
jgi:hypothetical protein